MTERAGLLEPLPVSVRDCCSVQQLEELAQAILTLHVPFANVVKSLRFSCF